MAGRSPALLPAVAAVAVGVASAPAAAELFVDLYTGRGATESADVTVTTADVNLPGFVGARADLENVATDRFSTVGLRLGHWFEAVPQLGVAVDVFRFAPDVGRQTVRATATATFAGEILGTPVVFEPDVSGRLPLPELDIPTTGVAGFDVLLRLPLLPGPAAPHGRLQPYLSAGPALLLTDAEPEATLGFKLGAGLAWQVHRHLALFGEYRYTRFRPEIEVGGVLLGPLEIGDLEVEVDLETHYLLAGLSFRF